MRQERLQEWRFVGKITHNRLHGHILATDEDGKREYVVAGVDDAHPIISHLERRMRDFKLMADAPKLYNQLAAQQAEIKKLREALETIRFQLNGEVSDNAIHALQTVRIALKEGGNPCE